VAPSAAWLASVLALPALDAESTDRVLGGETAALMVSAESIPIWGSITVTSDPTPKMNGTVRTVLGGDRATLLVVPADGDLYLVEAADTSVLITPRPFLDRSRSSADITLTDAPAVRLHADAAQTLADAALRAAVLTAADALGAATRMRELAVEYSTQRTQYGQLIGSFQAMKHAAATMLVREEAARSVVYYAAASVDTRLEQHDLHAAAAKAQATAAASDAAESSLTMHGAIGYTWEHDLQLLYKRAKLDVALFGAPTEWNERIASSLLAV
jgi:alkylation response protein AidB-like acyl-CoA dehydrogenase